MGIIDRYKHIKYKNNSYTIFPIVCRTKIVPIIVDTKDFVYIKNLEKSWYINDSGAVVCHHTFKDQNMELYLHEIVMALKAKDAGETILKIPIIHINRLSIDNRRENLMYDTVDKNINKNMVKKKRIIILPKKSGINPDNIPTFVWYMKPDTTHGDRFMVTVGDISWKTSSSPKYSLKYKLEEAKKFLRALKILKPQLFDEYSMNGELNYDGKSLLNSFYNLVQQGGFNVSKSNNNDLTDKYLKEDLNNLTVDEIACLKSFSPKNIILG